MPRQRFRTINFHATTQERIDQLTSILDEYGDQQLTARQCYYQFVARGLLANTERNYKMITKLITDARYAGIVDWDQIEDRGRPPRSPNQFDDLSDLVETALRAYRLPRWKGQQTYCELWVEKQALAGVLEPLASRFHVTLMVNKGYSSASAMKQSADRMRAAQGVDSDAFNKWLAAFHADAPDDERSKAYTTHAKRGEQYVTENTRDVVLFYLGDHDPSGKDMVRDIRERLEEFGVWRLTVKHLGLTMPQIKRFKPPPNPTKLTDSRAKEYIKEYGNQSWELDALPPRELNNLVETAFKATIDQPMMDVIIKREERDRKRLRKAVKSLIKTKKKPRRKRTRKARRTKR